MRKDTVTPKKVAQPFFLFHFQSRVSPIRVFVRIKSWRLTEKEKNGTNCFAFKLLSFIFTDFCAPGDFSENPVFESTHRERVLHESTVSSSVKLVADGNIVLSHS